MTTIPALTAAAKPAAPSQARTVDEIILYSRPATGTNPPLLQFSYSTSANGAIDGVRELGFQIEGNGIVQKPGFIYTSGDSKRVPAALSTFQKAVTKATPQLAELQSNVDPLHVALIGMALAESPNPKEIVEAFTPGSYAISINGRPNVSIGQWSDGTAVPQAMQDLFSAVAKLRRGMPKPTEG